MSPYQLHSVPIDARACRAMPSMEMPPYPLASSTSWAASSICSWRMDRFSSRISFSEALAASVTPITDVCNRNRRNVSGETAITQSGRQPVAALATLILLQAAMLSALYAGIRPHPPMATTFFGIAPFIGASVSIAVAALIRRPPNTTAGRMLSILAALAALVSFGPQNYFDARFRGRASNEGERRRDATNKEHVPERRPRPDQPGRSRSLPALRGRA